MLGLALLAAAFLRAEEYRVAGEDTLAIKVMGHSEFDGTYGVDPDGSISFPMLGTVPVGGMSLEEIRAKLTTRLGNGFLRYPVVTVALTDSKRKLRFFIYGEVKSPGEYPLPLETLTALKAVTMAGGVTKGGSETRIKIMRPAKGEDAYQVIKIDLKAVMSSGEGDAVVKDGDILIVKEGWF